jgi:DNA replication protein DnaC
MELKKILKAIEQQRPKAQDKVSNNPRFDPIKVRESFVKILNNYCLKNSHGKMGLILDKETENAIELICQYYNREPKFEENGYSFHKGLWIAGNFGTGKTQMMLAYRDLKKVKNENVGFQSCVDMNMRFVKKDEFNNQIARFDGIKAFANKLDTTERIFDDLGEEETTVLDYGNKVCIMAHIVSERYKGLKTGCITHITTNLTTKQISDIYGGRIESRINEMFNIIKLGSKIDSVDYRK